MRNQKKRKFKRWFKNLIYLLCVFIIVSTIFFLQSEKLINLKNIYNESKSFIINIFKKNNEVKSIPLTKSEILINFFKDKLTSEGYIFSHTEIDNNNNLKLFLKNTYQDDGYLYLNIEEDPNTLWLNFLSAIKAEPLKTKLADNFSSLEYIDLRFDNKIFYKFNDTAVNITNTENKSLNNSTSSENTNQVFNPNIAIPASLNIETTSSSN